MPRIEQINNTTFEGTLAGSDKVEIGDKEAIDFKPHIKLNRWDGECYIKVGLPTTEKVFPVVEADKIKFEGKDLEAHFYPLEPRTIIAKDKDGKDHRFKQNELGGFEFEIILKRKPRTNKIILNIETQKLKFHYQPPLTPQEIDEGCIRPDNVVGSYAVYHSTRGNMHRGKETAEKYKTGKAFHIYRPKITSAKGNWVWGELSIDEQAGTLTTTIPQDFLDAAVYPISTGTTDFGYTGHGSFASSSDYIFSNNAISPASNGDGVSISCYVKKSTAAKSRCALYDSSDSSLKGETEEKDVPVAEGWLVHNFSGTPTILSAKSYFICMIQNVITIYFYDSVGGEGRYKSLTWSNGFPGWPDPLGAWTGTNWGNKLGIYCTYEEAAAGWSHKFLGVANASIGKINGVSLASINKVNGVA